MFGKAAMLQPTIPIASVPNPTRAGRRLRVLLISHTCQSRTKGQPRAEWLARQPDLDLCVLAPDRFCEKGVGWTDDEPPDGSAGYRYEVGRVRLPWAGPLQVYLHHYPKMADLFREFRPDVIDLWEEPWGAVSAQAVRLRNRLLPGSRIVAETEQNLDKRLPPPFHQFRRYTLANADHLIGRSDEAVDVCRDRGFDGPTDVVPNAVDVDLFRPMDRAAARSALGCEGFVVGYVGRFVPEKGLGDLLDAVARCPADVGVLLVGGGPMEADLRRRAEALGLGKRFRLMKPRPQTELPAIFNAFDALALPSRTTGSWKEQFGRVIIEAQACGTPVIGSGSGAIPSVVREGGLIVPERNPAALAAAIRRLRDDPAAGRRLGAVGRRQVEETYSWRCVAERMADIYRGVECRKPTLIRHVSKQSMAGEAVHV